MAIRFRKSIKLAPGIRMNLSGSGVSWNLGPRGMSIGIGKRGTYLNAGLPGTGLSMRHALHSGGRANASSQPRSPGVANVPLTVSVADDGTITFKDETGSPVSDNMIALAKRQQGDAIMGLIQQKCDQINEQVTALGNLHLDTPDPMSRHSHQAAPFTVDPPRAATAQVPGFIARIFKSQRKRIEQANAKSQAEHQAAMAEWLVAKDRFERTEAHKLALVDKSQAGDVDAMEQFFSDVLNDVVWPRETLVSFEVHAGGTDLVFDVDLPEVEDMPNKTASVPQRGFRLSVKEMGPTAVQKLYAQHIHAVVFRLIGEAFGMLPTLQTVTLSGYTQRKDSSSGHTVDHYLLSVVIARSAWMQLNFADLPSIDPVEALARFQLRREMTKTGVFKPIESF